MSAGSAALPSGAAGGRGQSRGKGGGQSGGKTDRRDPNHLGHLAGGEGSSKAAGHGTGGPAPKRIVVGYGFWLFILSDIVMFSAFFASYAVLHGGTDNGPTGRELFDLGNTAIETGCLLLSSFACGLASLAVIVRRQLAFYAAMGATFILGATFVGLEAHEFSGLIVGGNGPDRSAFLSSFFSLVGLHGIHVSIGLLWLLTMMAQVFAKGFRDDINRRIMCFALFWHALDIVWVGIFSIVYLMGSIT